MLTYFKKMNKKHNYLWSMLFFLISFISFYLLILLLLFLDIKETLYGIPFIGIFRILYVLSENAGFGALREILIYSLIIATTPFISKYRNDFLLWIYPVTFAIYIAFITVGWGISELPYYIPPYIIGIAIPILILSFFYKKINLSTKLRGTKILLVIGLIVAITLPLFHNFVLSSSAPTAIRKFDCTKIDKGVDKEVIIGPRSYDFGPYKWDCLRYKEICKWVIDPSMECKTFPYSSIEAGCNILSNKEHCSSLYTCEWSLRKDAETLIKKGEKEECFKFAPAVVPELSKECLERKENFNSYYPASDYECGEESNGTKVGCLARITCEWRNTTHQHPNVRLGCKYPYDCKWRDSHCYSKDLTEVVKIIDRDMEKYCAKRIIVRKMQSISPQECRNRPWCSFKGSCQPR